MIRLRLILLFAVSAPLMGEDKKSVHQQTNDALKQAFHFSPQPEAAVEASDQEASVVVLERLTIVQSFNRRQLEQSIQAYDERMKAEGFTLTDGGTLLGKGQMQLGIWPSGKGLIFLRLRW